MSNEVISVNFIFHNIEEAFINAVIRKLHVFANLVMMTPSWLLSCIYFRNNQCTINASVRLYVMTLY